MLPIYSIMNSVTSYTENDTRSGFWDLEHLDGSQAAAKAFFVNAVPLGSPFRMQSSLLSSWEACGLAAHLGQPLRDLSQQRQIANRRPT